jgi:carbamoyl-phosphate synthase large subunit
VTRRPLTLAVTGLNATDNPAPGVAVLRALRDAYPDAHLVGLGYDALDPGIYAEGLAQNVYLMPYPSQGSTALLDRLAYIHEQIGLDAIVPTLDAELPGFIDAAPRLLSLGIATFLPTREQLELRGKGQLAALGARTGLPVPATAVVTTFAELVHVHHRVPYPFFVKGVFYGATLAHNLDEAVAAFHKVVAQWGVPVVVQTLVKGDEVNVVAVGDGEGGLVGAVAMKKLMLTDKGKGWAGVTIKDDALIEHTRAFMAATGWRGPCELELIRDSRGSYHLIEINPRFPAWVYLAPAAGVNLPRAVVELALGRPLSAMPEYSVGTVFVRISLDQIARMEDLQRILTFGELGRPVAAPAAAASVEPVAAPAPDPKPATARKRAASRRAPSAPRRPVEGASP